MSDKAASDVASSAVLAPGNWRTEPPAVAASDEFRLLLAALRHPGPLTVAGPTRGGFAFETNLTLDQAVGVAGRRASRNTWFSVNPTLVEGGGRGRARDVVGLTSLYADLDVKAGGLDSYETCWAVVDDLCHRLRVAPTAVVDSGHGLQPYWRLGGVRWGRGDQESRRVSSDVLLAFRFAVEEVAAGHGGHVDIVFDLARILRVPGTINIKEPDRPVMARLAHVDPDVQPLELGEALKRVGPPPGPSNRQVDLRPSTLPASVSGTAEDLITQVEEATEGQRNNTLNRAVFLLARDGNWTQGVADQVRDRAVRGGQREAPVERTIASALRAAEDATREVDEWLDRLLGDLERERPRNRVALALVGRHMRDLVVRLGQPVGISCRRLADQLQIPKSTAASYLRWLTKNEWLTLAGARTDPDRSRRYRLSSRESPNLDSRPWAVELYEEAVQHGQLSRFARSHTGLYSHDAFSRINGSTTMPKSCAVVLEVLSGSPHEPHTVKEVSRLTTYSPSTIRRAVQVLESAGFVHYTPRAGVRLLDSHSSWVDAWAAWSGASGNRDRRRRRHEADREAHSRAWQPGGG